MHHGSYGWKGSVYHWRRFRHRPRGLTPLRAGRRPRVVIAELKPELGRAVEATIRDAGGDALFIETDVTREDSVKGAIQQTVSRFGKLDVLYNCAGGSIVQDAPVTEVDMSVWQHTISLDLLGPFHCCRHGIPELIKAGGGAKRMTAPARGCVRGCPSTILVCRNTPRTVARRLTFIVMASRSDAPLCPRPVWTRTLAATSIQPSTNSTRLGTGNGSRPRASATPALRTSRIWPNV